MDFFYDLLSLCVGNGRLFTTENTEHTENTEIKKRKSIGIHVFSHVLEGGR